MRKCYARKKCKIFLNFSRTNDQGVVIERVLSIVFLARQRRPASFQDWFAAENALRRRGGRIAFHPLWERLSQGRRRGLVSRGDQTFEAVPRFENMLAMFEVGGESSIGKILSLAVKLKMEYDSHPSEDVEALDATFVSELTYLF